MIKLKKILLETPDSIATKSVTTSVLDYDATTFMYNIVTDEFFSANRWTDGFERVTPYITHDDVHEIFPTNIDRYGNDAFIYGRYWTESKLISIWELLSKYKRRYTSLSVLKKIFDLIAKDANGIYAYKIDLGKQPPEKYNTVVDVSWFFKNYSLCIDTMDFKIDTQRLPHIIPLQKLEKTELDAYLIKGIVPKKDYDREINRRKSAPTVYKPANY